MIDFALQIPVIQGQAPLSIAIDRVNPYSFKGRYYNLKMCSLTVFP
jgi:hypothetical protein